MTADNLQPFVRMAQTGDVCLLLMPSRDELAAIREWQVALQAIFGGRVAADVHLTLQRFAVRDETMLTQIGEQLRWRLSAVSPFAIQTNGLAQWQSVTRQSHLLRWRIALDDDLRRLSALAEQILDDCGGTQLYQNGWQPVLATALEDVLEVGRDTHAQIEYVLDELREPLGQIVAVPNERCSSARKFPCRFFTVTRVVVSRIKGAREYEIVDTFELSR